ncbi:MAG: DUF3179 domain-containing protein [Anaerolineae bacterium]|nr:DUF3179 domain-containing protein [Anaerolineae bacterium]
MRQRFPIVSHLILVLSISWLALGHSTRAQSTCDDPFEGQSVYFNTAYWERTDFCQHSIAYDEVLSGGPPPDGIPPIDNPQFESIDVAETWLQPQSPVLAVELDSEARAYPLAILTWHEIVNDTIGSVPVAVTFCPLCNSAFVFDRRVGDDVLRFGVSGNLRNSNLIMWDDQTQSWWQQFTGEAVVGSYLGTQLTQYPAIITGFGAFVEQYPDGLVLSRDTGFGRSYGTNPYVNYDQSTDPFLFASPLDRRLPATEHVLAGFIGSTGVAYPFPVLRAEKVINDVVNDVPVLALWQSGSASALGGASIDDSEDIGWAALYRREINGQILTFTNDVAGVIRDQETSTIWNAFGEAIEGELAGAQLERMIAAPHFWFAWAAFDVETIIYGSD